FEKVFFDNAMTPNWRTYKNQIRKEWLTNLIMISDTLSYRSPEPKLENAEIENILKLARELVGEIKKADIPTDVKRFMVASLNEICAAVDQYMVFGFKAISDAIN